MLSRYRNRSQWTGEAMIYIVEVKDKAGNVATKEYQALSAREALRMAERELEAYPKLYINEVWRKGTLLPGLFGTRAAAP